METHCSYSRTCSPLRTAYSQISVHKKRAQINRYTDCNSSWRRRRIEFDRLLLSQRKVDDIAATCTSLHACALHLGINVRILGLLEIRFCVLLDSSFCIAHAPQCSSARMLNLRVNLHHPTLHIIPDQH